MKAIVLANQFDGQMQPITLSQPLSMVTLFGQPVLEHLLLLLRRNSFEDVAIVTDKHAEQIETFFGDGHCYGMYFHYLHSDEWLNESISFVGKDDFFAVVQGNLVCDFDLMGALEQHKQAGALATLLLHRTSNTAHSTFVQTDANGKILGFPRRSEQKNHTVHDVYTGISFFHRRVFEHIDPHHAQDAFFPDCDFFPHLLSRGELLMGFLPYGAWYQLSDCHSYLTTVQDILAGKLRMEYGVPQIRGGVWCGSELSDGVTVLPPCYIAENVTISSGAIIGAGTVLESASVVKERAVIQGSVLFGATVEQGSALSGAILCPNAIVHAGAVLNEGTVLGTNAVVEQNAILHAGVKIWDNLRVKSGTRLNTSLTSHKGAGQIFFEENSTICGRMGFELTPEMLLAIGSALGTEGRVGLGACDTAAAQSLLMAAAAGVVSAGGTAVLHDCTLPSSAAWLSGAYALPIALFIAQEGEMLTLFFFEPNGLPLSRPRQRKLEKALLSGTVHRASAGQVGQREQLTDADPAYLADAVRRSGTGAVRPLTIYIPTMPLSNFLLKLALSQLGMNVQSQPENADLSLSLSSSGQHLFVQANSHTCLSSEQLLLLTLFLLIENGEREFVLPLSAPLAADTLAQAHGCTILRTAPEDSRAKEHAQHQLALRDGIFTACLLCRRLAQSGETLSRLLEQLPVCCCKQQELSLSGDNERLLDQLCQRYPDAQRTGSSVRILLGGGSVFVEPKNRFSALRIASEAHSTEAANELCTLLYEEAQALDSK